MEVQKWVSTNICIRRPHNWARRANALHRQVARNAREFATMLGSCTAHIHSEFYHSASIGYAAECLLLRSIATDIRARLCAPNHRRSDDGEHSLLSARPVRFVHSHR